MRAPAFWWRRDPTIAASLLAPAGALFGAVTAARMRRPGTRVAVPVICVGNLVVGGAGKTPVALALARMLQAAGDRPAFLSRGYGRRGPVRSGAVLTVDPHRHGAVQCGDEPLLLARVAPTFVSADRLAAARTAVPAGATHLIMDDGLQNPALIKDLSVAVVDGAVGIGNGLCIPAGPMRAPAARQWPHVSLLCVVGQGEPGRAVAASAEAAGVPVMTARIVPDQSVVSGLRGRPLIGFAGIARPEKFFDTLAAAGLIVVGQRSFPDHHVFTAGELAGLRADADRTGATLVTTTKDRVRLPDDFRAEAVPADIVFDDLAAMEAALDRTGC